MHLSSCKIYPLSQTNKDKFLLYSIAPSFGIASKQLLPFINLYFLLLSISLHNPQCVPFEVKILVLHDETQISSGNKINFPLPQLAFTSTHLFPSSSKINFLSEGHSSEQSLPFLIAQTR